MSDRVTRNSPSKAAATAVEPPQDDSQIVERGSTKKLTADIKWIPHFVFLLVTTCQVNETYLTTGDKQEVKYKKVQATLSEDRDLNEAGIGKKSWESIKKKFDSTLKEFKTKYAFISGKTNLSAFDPEVSLKFDDTEQVLFTITKLCFDLDEKKVEKTKKEKEAANKMLQFEGAILSKGTLHRPGATPVGGASRRSSSIENPSSASSVSSDSQARISISVDEPEEKNEDIGYNQLRGPSSASSGLLGGRLNQIMETSARAEEKELENESLRLQIELASQQYKLAELQAREAERKAYEENRRRIRDEQRDEERRQRNLQRDAIFYRQPARPGKRTRQELEAELLALQQLEENDGDSPPLSDGESRDENGSIN